MRLVVDVGLYLWQKRLRLHLIKRLICSIIWGYDDLPVALTSDPDSYSKRYGGTRLCLTSHVHLSRATSDLLYLKPSGTSDESTNLNLDPPIPQRWRSGSLDPKGTLANVDNSC